MTTQCCQCGKIRKDDQWVEKKKLTPVNEIISHGYCPHCAMLAHQEFEAFNFVLNPVFMRAQD